MLSGSLLIFKSRIGILNLLICKGLIIQACVIIIWDQIVNRILNDEMRVIKLLRHLNCVFRFFFGLSFIFSS